MAPLTFLIIIAAYIGVAFLFYFCIRLGDKISNKKNKCGKEVNAELLGACFFWPLFLPMLFCFGVGKIIVNFIEKFTDIIAKKIEKKKVYAKNKKLEAEKKKNKKRTPVLVESDNYRNKPNIVCSICAEEIGSKEKQVVEEMYEEEFVLGSGPPSY